MTTRRRAGVSVAPAVRGLAVVLGVVAAVSCDPAIATAGPDSHKLVVVLYPDESDGAPGIVLVNRAIRSTFASQSAHHVEIHNEYVDTSRLRDAEFRQAQVSLLRRKYAGQKVDLVIAGLSFGLDFALEHREELFPGVPIVFVAVDQREVNARRLPPDVIGVPIRMDLAGTLDLALRFHPDTRRVYVIAGSSPFDADWEAEARRTFAPYQDRLEFVYLSGLSLDELRERVAHLPEQSIVYYLHVHQDGTGKPFFPAEALERLALRANTPIYGHVDTYVGRGIVGGRVFSFEAEGNNAARLGLRILAGERPESITVSEVSANADTFDWRQLRRWGISEESLPPGSVVQFREPTFWDNYRWHVIGVVSLCAVETLLIVGLLLQRVKRLRADERFRQVVETAPTGMLTIGRDGTIAMVNARVEKLFGYERNELLGQPVGLLLPELSRDRHPADRACFFTAPEAHPTGLGRDLFGRRKDGSEIPVEIGFSPLQTPRGLFVLASIVDLTERRQAEDGLRASQRELQCLTGRLLEAQEAERRRIARELHDDLNQTLALVAVEMDLLVAEPSGLPAKTTVRLREVLARVQELSSAVHDLSHQLHPSKLEQVGLVTAVRGLCKELTHGHGLEARFTHHGVPDPIHADTALCLYRIVQEALRNVIKHGGTRHATVDLGGTAEEIRLRVTDDGVGFDPATTNGGGLGLVSMRERLHLVGGRIRIDSRPGGGTRIDVRVPVLPPGSPDPTAARWETAPVAENAT
jgi:PAS domain S-box-containing protein